MARIVLKTLNRKNKFLYGQSRSLSYPIKILSYPILSPRLWNTGLVSSGANLTSWGEGASLVLIDHPSSDGVLIEMPYGVYALHRPASHPIFSYWVS